MECVKGPIRVEKKPFAETSQRRFLFLAVLRPPAAALSAVLPLLHIMVVSNPMDQLTPQINWLSFRDSGEPPQHQSARDSTVGLHSGHPETEAQIPAAMTLALVQLRHELQQPGVVRGNEYREM